MKTRQVKLKILRQGAPIVNDAYIRIAYSKIVAIDVDLRSKYCEIDSYMGDTRTGLMSISIGVNERSIKLNTKKGYLTTEICFPEYKNWSIFSAELSRYSLRVCLIKNKKVK